MEKRNILHIFNICFILLHIELAYIVEWGQDFFLLSGGEDRPLLTPKLMQDSFSSGTVKTRSLQRVADFDNSVDLRDVTPPHAGRALCSPHHTTRSRAFDALAGNFWLKLQAYSNVLTVSFKMHLFHKFTRKRMKITRNPVTAK